MKAMILRTQGSMDVGPLGLAMVPDPEPGPGQLRLRVSACGFCHTDLHVIEGDLPAQKLPLVPGHQVVGVVDMAGPATGRLRPGDRVGVPWLHSTCGQCQFCVMGCENLSTSARFTGYQEDGGYAQHAVVREDFACRLPEGFSDLETAPILCAGIIGYRALRLSETKPEWRLGLYGFESSAHIAIQVAPHWGAGSTSSLAARSTRPWP